MLFGKGFVKRG